MFNLLFSQKTYIDLFICILPRDTSELVWSILATGGFRGKNLGSVFDGAFTSSAGWP